MQTNWKKIYFSVIISLFIFIGMFLCLWLYSLREAEKRTTRNDITTTSSSTGNNSVWQTETEINNESETFENDNEIKNTSSTSEELLFVEALKELENKEDVYIRFVDHDVPFTSQAPNGEWNDIRQQDGCEEASSLMLYRYMNNDILDSEISKNEIITISEFEKNTFGSYVDTSASDTAERILKGHFGINGYKIVNLATLEELIKLVMDNNLIIAPMDGQSLDNPYYTPPGPERHMILIRGYDPEKNEFITNDPGTRHGEAYRYPEEVFYAAIRDYPSGNEEPILRQEKNIISVKSSRQPVRETPLFYNGKSD